MTSPTTFDPSRALDEIFELRRLLAYEAGALQVHLEHSRFPKSRRPYAENQIARMQFAARGSVVHAIHGISYLSLGHEMRQAGASAHLTIDEWVNEWPAPNPGSPAPTDETFDQDRAMQEIRLLRGLAAYEAGIIRAHLGFRSFPKSRRPIAEQQIERLHSAVIGRVRHATGGINSRSLRSALLDAGADECLTRTQWDAEPETHAALAI